MGKYFIGILRFDAITTFKEFQEIVMAMLELGFNIEIHKLPNEGMLPKYSAWQLEITKEKERE